MGSFAMPPNLTDAAHAEGRTDWLTSVPDMVRARDWISTWDGLTPLDAATREGHDGLATWLKARGARPASDRT